MPLQKGNLCQTMTKNTKNNIEKNQSIPQIPDIIQVKLLKWTVMKNMTNKIWNMPEYSAYFRYIHRLCLYKMENYAKHYKKLPTKTYRLCLYKMDNYLNMTQKNIKYSRILRGFQVYTGDPLYNKFDMAQFWVSWSFGRYFGKCSLIVAFLCFFPFNSNYKIAKKKQKCHKRPFFAD